MKRFGEKIGEVVGHGGRKYDVQKVCTNEGQGDIDEG